VEDVEGALKQAELKPECLALEMTESSIMGNAEQTLITLNRLKNMGVSLGIDDFGTGYSSLSYLQRLPFDTLKIDRSFVRELTAGKGSMDIVRAILELARSLKLEVIAEGVETEQQLCRLRKLGCPYYQGFLFSKPVDAAAAESLYGQTRDSGFFTLASEARSPADLKPSLFLT
jgi:EAL domain-containing protein (putative c-di-GMP-specific phosphodiesterase class I)